MSSTWIVEQRLKRGWVRCTHRNGCAMLWRGTAKKMLERLQSAFPDREYRMRNVKQK